MYYLYYIFVVTRHVIKRRIFYYISYIVRKISKSANISFNLDTK